MKRLAILLLLFGCARRETAPPVAAQSQPSTATTATAAQPATPLVVPKPHGVSTPAKCAGDGSYEQALECFRMTSGFRFHLKAPGIDANGSLQRPRIAEERVTIGEWMAEAKPTGIVWTHKGARDHATAQLEKLYQRLTIFLDPQKKEGTAQLVDSTDTTNHYHFTDANLGEPYDVWVAKDDGRMVRFRVGDTEVAIR